MRDRCASYLLSTCSRGEPKADAEFAMSKKCINRVSRAFLECPPNGTECTRTINKVQVKFFNYAKCHQDFATQHQSICITRKRALCRLRPIQIFKLIRLDMSLVQRLFDTLPNMYLIYQYRDPRGILFSRLSHAGLLTHSLADEAKILCSNIIFDLDRIHRVTEQHSARIIFMKYEDLVVNGTQEAERLYSLIGETLPNTVKEWLNYATSSSHNTKKYMYGTNRKNATETAFQWKTMLTSEQLELINDVCGDALRALNYSWQTYSASNQRSCKTCSVGHGW